MKFRLERDVLAEAVAWAARTLPSRPSMPMLAGLLIDATAEGLTLSSFDYEVSGRVAIGADVTRLEEFCHQCGVPHSPTTAEYSW